MEKENLNTSRRSRNRIFHNLSISLGVVALISSVLTFLDFGKDQFEEDNQQSGTD